MAKHEITYSEDGLALTDPWSLTDYLQADGLSPLDIERVSESVLSWLREYATAGCDLREALDELARQQS